MYVRVWVRACVCVRGYVISGKEEKMHYLIAKSYGTEIYLEISLFGATS